MKNEERKKYLNKHEYSIFQGNDGRWKTTLIDPITKKRKIIAKTKLVDLEDIIIEHYKDIECQKRNLKSDITLREIYPIWRESRILEVNSIGTVKKNEQDWKRYYLNDPIIDIPLCKLTPNTIKDWAHKKIDDYSLNKRSFYNMTVILKKCLEFAEDEGVCKNIWNSVRINTKKLVKEKKKDNSTQIYFYDEKLKLVNYCLYMFSRNDRNIGALIIPLLFITGMRIGEVVALKYEDFTDTDIIIRRSETTAYVYDNERDKFCYEGKPIMDNAKTDAGERTIPYTKGAKQIINMVKASSDKYGYYDRGYVFCPHSKRMQANSVGKKITSYCDAIGIPKKSAHKIRKTYISQIIKEGIDLDTVCRVVGHVDFKTTFESYLFSLDRKDETHQKFENVLGDVKIS